MSAGRYSRPFLAASTAARSDRAGSSEVRTIGPSPGRRSRLGASWDRMASHAPGMWSLRYPMLVCRSTTCVSPDASGPVLGPTVRQTSRTEQPPRLLGRRPQAMSAPVDIDGFVVTVFADHSDRKEHHGHESKPSRQRRERSRHQCCNAHWQIPRWHFAYTVA